ncbi:dicarboxylate/amino acid:cation symporter [uncultured Odoribacter sp.]|uniref:dicarboxylate/amino acid:cation symporter n=1 Tax=uncultured Odoribacter sp. TaxID=876416 RepID=UPI0026348742|nr:dicarboxylate/amino acid:cation symporter [uncultured Odoribacter sp.]
MWKRIPLYVKILAGMGIGLLLGFTACALHFEGFVSDWIRPWGTIFIRLLKLVAVPLVFISLIKGVGGLKDISRLSRMGLKTIAIYIGTTVIAISVGLLMVSMIDPGKVFPREKAEEYRGRYERTVDEKKKAAEEIQDAGPLAFLVDMVPENLIQAGSDNTRMLQIIFVALLSGMAMVAVGGEKMKTLMHALDAADAVILKIIDYIMQFAPWGVLGVMASLVVDFAGNGEIFAALGMYAFTVILSLLLMIFLFYPSLIRLFSSVKIKQFFRAMSPVQLLAFSTSSSAATLPLTLERTEQELKISNEVVSFVLPVGVTINMDGTSCYQAVATVFIAQVMGLDLTFSQMLVIVFMTTLSSIGTPGIPGGSIVMFVMVLSSVGIPVEGLALILGLDRPLDMLRTVVNVTGDATVACIVEEGEKKFRNGG